MNSLMQGAPMGAAPPPGAPPAVSPQQIADARAHVGVMMDALMKLAQKPHGSLSKRDLYDSVADMIGQGAFSTPQAKAQLVAEISQIPDDEPSIRQAVGAHLMKLAQFQGAIHQQFGPGA